MSKTDPRTVTLSGLGQAEPVDDSELLPGARLGRYHVLERLGAGGMGVVYSAYDPELGRRVAIKVLRDGWLLRTGAEEARRRLLSEGQALARLSHPNVIPVYDAGTVEGQLFVAMEQVAGVSLREWSSGRRRSWSEVVGVYRQAAAGLAAAHAAGLVHRDFKPSNAMLGDDGRVRVLDFGLARDAGPVSGADAEVAGTPAYMAPEQLAGHPADARGDQLSFCASLFEALHGHLPGEASEEAVETARAPVPVWLRRLLERGLDPRPERRFPSMEALNRALDQGLGRRRRRRRTALAVLVAGATVAAGFLTPRRDLCSGAAGRVAEVWGPWRHEAVRRSFAASGQPYASATFDAVAARLDAYAGAWAAQHTAACEATRRRGEQSETLMDLRMACLDRRLVDLAALVDLFERRGREVVGEAVRASDGLPRLEACEDVSTLTAVLPPPDAPARRQDIQARRELLAEARALREAGRYGDGLATAEEVLAGSVAAGYAPLTAEARHRLADLTNQTGDPVAAEREMIAALRDAEAGRHDALRAEILVDLGWIVGYRQGRPAEGRGWLTVAEGALSRLREPVGLEERWYHATALVSLVEGDAAAAAEAARAAVESSRRRPDGADETGTARYLSTLGHAQLRLGFYEDAFETFSRVLEIRTRVLGAEHPRTGAAEQALGTTYRLLGRYGDAERLLRRALPTCVQGFGADSQEVATVRTELGSVLLLRGRYSEALEHHLAALVVHRERFGDAHPQVAISGSYVGETLTELGRFDEAEARLTAAIEAGEGSVGAEHEIVGYTWVSLGDLRLRQGRPAEAEACYRRAREIFAAALGETHPDQVYPILGLGESALGQGRLDEARELLETAVSHPGVASPVIRAASRFALARALWRTGERERARRLAEEARTVFAELGRDGWRGGSGVEDWLAGLTPKDRSSTVTPHEP